MKSIKSLTILFFLIITTVGLFACGEKESEYTFNFEEGISTELVAIEGYTPYIKITLANNKVCYIIPSAMSLDPLVLHVEKKDTGDKVGSIAFSFYSDTLDLNSIQAKVDGKAMTAQIVPEAELSPSIMVNPSAGQDGYLTLPTIRFNIDDLDLGSDFVVSIEGLIQE